MDNQTTAPQSPADRAQTVGHDTKQAAQGVASTAGEEAKKTTREAKDQARQLWGQARSDVTDQAASQQTRAATGLRELSDQLQSMAQGAGDDGMARGLVEDVARRAGDAASWLDQRDPGSLLEEARGFARRRPMAFLAAAAGLGVIAGRMSRGLVDEARDTSGTSTGGTGSNGYSASMGTTPVATGGTAPMFTEGTVPTSPTGVGTGTGTGISTGTASATGDLSGLPRTSQPLEPDGSLTPIDAEGQLTAGDDLRGDGPGGVGGVGR